MRLNVITNAELEGARREDSLWSAVVLLDGWCLFERSARRRHVVSLDGGVLEAVVQPGTPQVGDFFVVQLPEEAKGWSVLVPEGVEQAHWTTVICNFERSLQVV